MWRTNALLFANATRSLLKEQGAPVLYTVTTPEQSPNQTYGLHCILQKSQHHAHQQGGGGISASYPRSRQLGGTPVWPWLVAAALAVLVAERSLAAWRGGPWC